VAERDTNKASPKKKN